MMALTTTRNDKNSLTFESVVCSQLELQRRAASFSHRRNTMCRRSSQCRLSSSSSSSNRLSVSSNRIMLLPPVSSQLSIPYTSNRTSISTQSDNSAVQFIKTRNLNNSKRSRTSSAHSMLDNRFESITDRQSLGSIFYWDASSRDATNKKNESRWSLDFPKETPFYWSLRSRLIEEYTESESLLEFAKKTVLVLMKTSNFNLFIRMPLLTCVLYIEEATVFLCVLLVLPIIMMGIGVSHLGDCPRQPNLPIYLFVAGIVSTTKLLQNIWHKYRLQQKRLTDEEPSSNHTDGHAFIDGLMTSFLVIWFFFGQYWFITIGYPPHFEQLLEDPDIWCHKTVVYGALASIVIAYFLLISFIGVVIFLVFFTRYTIIKQASVH